jgi:NAD(P)-dependent dehydrogenase (short-subunit alcohol dehydrogenase family)
MADGAPRSFKNKTVVITGGGSGVGFECAKLLAAQGASILLVGRNESKLKAASGEINSNKISYIAGDIANSKTAKLAFEYAYKMFEKPVDILVNNAGVIHRSDAKDTSDTDWQYVMDINVNGLFFFSRAFANQDINDGAIINVSSTCGQLGAAGLTAYCASKGAVDQITRTMALELAPRHINVNAVAPGAINSPMLFANHHEDVRDQTVIEDNIPDIPIGAIAEPQEVARSILFLASERHITGTILSVDGGYTAI